jgi:hypothetical protein
VAFDEGADSMEITATLVWNAGAAGGALTSTALVVDEPGNGRFHNDHGRRGGAEVIADVLAEASGLYRQCSFLLTSRWLSFGRLSRCRRFGSDFDRRMFSAVISGVSGRNLAGWDRRLTLSGFGLISDKAHHRDWTTDDRRQRTAYPPICHAASGDRNVVDGR